MVNGVNALRHIRHEPAAEILVVQTRQRSPERHSESNLQHTPVSQQAGRDSQLEQQHRRPKQGQVKHRSQALIDRGELRVEFDHPAKQQAFDKEDGSEHDKTDRGHDNRNQRLAPQIGEKTAQRLGSFLGRRRSHFPAASRVRGRGARAGGQSEQDGSAHVCIAVDAFICRPLDSARDKPLDRARDRSGVPVFGWDHGLRRRGPVEGARHQRIDHARRFRPALRGAALDHRRGEPRSRVEERQAPPVGRMRRTAHQPIRRSMAER
jgi:hypothetical protein